MVRKFILQICTFFIIMILSIGSIQNPYTDGFIQEIKRESIPVASFNDPLYLQIEEYAEKLNVPPADAVIDKVWKAIPGLNGIEVDIEASYEKMRKDGHFSVHKLVTKEKEPAVHLDDLPPTPIYRGNPNKKMITFLVNVAWGNEHLPSILKTMNEHNVKATFFLDGSWVKKNPKLAKMVLEEGHEIGNHAYSHPDMKNLTNARIKEEIQKTNDVINATLDVTPKWFAPPSGSYRQDVVNIAREMNMHTILWTVDTVDWRNPEPNAMVQKVVSKTDAGSMILMHPTASTAAGINKLIVQLKSEGYHIGTVSQLLSEKRLANSETSHVY